MPVTVRLSFNGEFYRQRGDVAARMALMDISQDAVDLMKLTCKVVTGTYQRSFHKAQKGYDDPSGDLYLAKKAEMDLDEIFDMGDTAPTQGLVVGSWVPYAILEEVDRGRPVVGPAMDAASVEWAAYCARHFAREGLS